MGELKISKRKANFFKAIMALLSGVVGVVAGEISLRVRESVRTRQSIYISDPLLGVRTIPHAPGHDALGFKNYVVPERVDIVAIGDSQTWGVNVDIAGTWPKQLADISGYQVYNMAEGGYGPVQYLLLFDEAKKLSPGIVVVGIYFGNDFYDAYQVTYTNNAHANLRANDFPGEWLQDTVTPAVDSVYQEREEFRKIPIGKVSSAYEFGEWLCRHTEVGKLLHRKGLFLDESDLEIKAAVRWANNFPLHGVVCRQEKVDTVLTTTYRLLAENKAEPRISEGIRITKQVMSQINKEASESGIKLLVVLIPTKEMVYADLMKVGVESNETYGKLVQIEDQLRGELIGFAGKNGINVYDSLPELRAALRDFTRIYPRDFDGHPVKEGYRVISMGVKKALDKMNGDKF
jgi:hypothetical protein